MNDREPAGSVTRHIGELKGGDQSAAGELWRRYFEQLVALAKRRIAARGGPTIDDEEDAALSAFHSLWAGARNGRFTELQDRDDLWKLLVVITARKVSQQKRRQLRQKRGGGRVRREAELRSESADESPGLEAVASQEPTPEFAAELAEECERRLALLPDDSLRRVATLRMEGYSNEHIAAQLGCVTRSVERKLSAIRQCWSDGE